MKCMRRMRGIVPVVALVLTLVGCQTSRSSNPAAEEGDVAASDHVTPINVIVVADLSDRITSRAQVARDSAVIDAVADAFRLRAKYVGFPFCEDRLRFQGIRSVAGSEDIVVDVGHMNAIGQQPVKELPKQLQVWGDRARQLYVNDGHFAGCDLWGYVAHDLDAVLVHGKPRNKLIVITDGYLNFAPKVARPANTEMHVAALRAAGARWESQFPRYALAGVGRRFEDCDLLVIEVAPKDPLRSVNEADILKRYWTSWAKELGMANADQGDYVLFENAPLSAVQERVKDFLVTP